MYKFILTDLKSRKTFDIYNILRTKKDIECVVKGKYSFIYKLIYNQCTFLNSSSFYDFQDSNYIYFPIEESSTLEFYEFIENNYHYNINYLLPSKADFLLVQNKKEFSDFCEKAHLPIPKEYNSADIKNNNFKLPLIVKPKIGSGSIGILHINTEAELKNLQGINYDDFIIQEKINSTTNVSGGFFIFKNGKFIDYYGHKRIRTYPLEGGVTTYSKYEYNETIKQEGIRLLSKLNWSGIAMVEFLYDELSKEYKIIEVNPRAWGSILLSESCNAQFIDTYIKLSTNQNINIKEKKEDSYIRWFLPFDLLGYFQSKHKIERFWKLNLSNTVYINFTYSNFFSAFLFFITNIFSFNKIKKLFKKILK